MKSNPAEQTERPDPGKELHAATAAEALAKAAIPEIEKGLVAIKARRVLIAEERARANQDRFIALASGDPKPFDDKLTALDKEDKVLDERTIEVNAQIREAGKILQYASQRRKNARVSVYAARMAVLADEINDHLVALHPMLLEAEALCMSLGISMAPVVAPGPFHTIISEKYPKQIILERN